MRCTSVTWDRGIDDARNVARIVLALWRSGVVCQKNLKDVQEKPRPAAPEPLAGSSEQRW